MNIQWQGKKMWGAIILLCLITLACYRPVLKSDFTNWDDKEYVIENPTIRSLSLTNVNKIFTSTVSGVYSPLTIFSYALEYHFFGLKPTVFHLTNLILHIGVVIFVFIFGGMCGLSLFGAFLSALIFAIHPIHVESVAWITERKDVLYAFFYMAALCAYAKYISQKSQLWYAMSLLLGWVSMLAKPMALSLPFVFFVCDWFWKRKFEPKIFWDKISYFLYIIPITWVTYSLHARLPVKNWWDAVTIWIYTFSFYIRQFFWPTHLCPKYELPLPISFSSGIYLVSLIGFVLCIILILNRERFKWMAWAVLYYFASIFFLLRFDIGIDFTIVADRFMYLPSLGFCMLLGYVFDQYSVKITSRKIFISCLVILFGGLIWLGTSTYQLALVWKDSVSLWTYVIKKMPQIAVAYNNRGEAYSALGQYDLALSDYQKALELDKNHSSTYSNIADIFSSQGRDDLALMELEKSIKLANSYQAFYNRGNIHHKLGKYELALNDYNEAVKINPDLPQAYNNRGVIFLNQKKYDEALEDFNKAIVVDGSFFEAYNNRSYLYIQKENYVLAVEDAARSIKYNPNNAMAYFNLGNANRLQGKMDLALEGFSRAIALDARNGMFFLHRSIIFFDRKEYNKALSDAQKAKSLGMNNVDAYIVEINQAIENLVK